ncbi:hypothetical protein [Streptomyces sp. NPDC018693]|uniref:hypothetical protein n=1 Tax=unclassified Streptomyces TaxID=2593676 RepID=UPI00379560D6
MQEIDAAWAQESAEFPSESSAGRLRSVTPYEEIEVDYARMVWRVASALARELLD